MDISNNISLTITETQIETHTQSYDIPSLIFIIPYRDRQGHKDMFIEHMTKILDSDSSTEKQLYTFYFSHQYDNRPFNRGAMKNIGFLAIKDKYPEHYKDMTFVFNDVDTLPSEKGLIDYNTTNGKVKHFYGYKFALGGIFSIKGSDFEKSKGFPNFWGWGIEDNALYDRCLEVGLTIDRSTFYDIDDKRILRTFDGFKRTISKRDSLIYKQKQHDSIDDLKNVKWNIDNEYINVSNFDCKMKPNEQYYSPIDIRNTKKIIVPKGYEFRRNWNLFKR